MDDFAKRKAHITKEKIVARAIRKSPWWDAKIRDANCYYCEKKISDKEATMDHIVPLSRGGKSNHGNIVVACKACNTAKGDLTAAEFLVEGR